MPRSRAAGIVLHLSEHHGDASPGARIDIHMRASKNCICELSAKNYRYGRPGLEEQPWGARTITTQTRSATG